MLRTGLRPMALWLVMVTVGCGSSTEPVAENDVPDGGDLTDTSVTLDTGELDTEGLPDTGAPLDTDVVTEGGTDSATVDTGSDATAEAATDTALPDTAPDTAKDTAPEVATGAPFGAACSSDSQCLSGICLSIGRCSRPCAGAGDCPASSNWSCVSLPGRGPSCSCTILGAQDIACNGIDENCDGRVDESARTCGIACVDINTDPANCGACGLVCGGGSVCKSGSCVCPPDKPAICGSSCVDVTNDAANCGTCGNACPGGANGIAACSGGTCALVCTPPFGNCNGTIADGCEKDLRYDTANCGTCGKTCSFASATAVCSTGSCVLSSCNPGYASCDGDPGNGCEVNTNTSLANCGGCGKACAPANGTGTCASGACDLVACNPGWANCNLSVSDGCEINTQGDLNNCGLCGKVCPGVGAANMTASCTTGTCGATCNPGWGNCDGSLTNGCEANLRTSTTHCGTCGNTCAPGNSCIDGACKTFVPVDVTLLLGVTGSSQPALDLAVPNLKSRLVAPLLALGGVNVGVSYTCEFPVSPYGSTGDRPFQGGAEPITVQSTLDALITGYPKQYGGDAADGMVEALGTLAGLAPHPMSLPLTCSTGRTVGGCWRSAVRKVVVLFTDDIFHNGPDPASTGLHAPYTGITPAPHAWPSVLSAMTSGKITLLIMNSNSLNTTSPGYGQYKEMLIDLGQTGSDIYPSNGATATGTAADAIVARIAAIRSGL